MGPHSFSNMTINGPSNEIEAAKPSMIAPRPMRVFVGVKVASTIASELAHLARDLEQFSVRLVAIGDVHLTLVPPWNEPLIPEAIDKMRSAAARFRSFALGFRRLYLVLIGKGPACYGPSVTRRSSFHRCAPHFCRRMGKQRIEHSGRMSQSLACTKMDA